MAAISFSSSRSGWAGALIVLFILWSLWTLKPSQHPEGVVTPTDLYDHVVPSKDTGRPYTDSPLDDGYKGVSEGNLAAPPLSNGIAAGGEESGVIGVIDAQSVDIPGDGSWKTPVIGNEATGSEKSAVVAGLDGDISWKPTEGSSGVAGESNQGIHNLGNDKLISTPSTTDEHLSDSEQSVKPSQSVSSAHPSDPAVADLWNPAEEEEDIPLVTFVYFEAPVARENILFFIKHGLHDRADFLFIINGETDIQNSIPKLPNVMVHAKENDCYDLGSHSQVLLKDDLWKNYKKFILMNASIRGPFFPVWANECWTDMFLSRITDTIKLVGITGNCWPTFHVQSMLWATDHIGMSLLLQPEAIGQCFHDWQTAVNAEIGSTLVIQKAGYKVDTMMTAFHGDINYIEHCEPSVRGDLLVEGGYFGSNIHPFETIFFKTNRNVDPILTDLLTKWIDGRNYSSYDTCGA